MSEDDDTPRLSAAQETLEKLKRKYRLYVVNDESFETVGTYELTPLNLYLFASLLVVAVVFFVLLLLVLTPLKNIIPGYADVNELSTRKEIVKIYRQIDSIERVVDAQQTYLLSVGKALRGEKDAADLQTPTETTEFAKVKTTLSQKIMNKTDVAPTAMTNDAPSASNTERAIDFSQPLSKGMITDAFKAQPDHFGVDIAAPKDSPVQAVADGIVICSSWTLDTGYIIGLQHPNNMISFYKHNSALLKKVGTAVRAGEAIAVIGNTGDLSSGPHLHLELWQNGKAVNPTDFIKF